MKIYRKVKIDILTGETLYEDSYEHDGEVAECKGGGGVDYAQSPEQRQVFESLMPIFHQIAGAAETGTSPWQIPSTQGLMPTEGWYSGIDSTIKRGMMEPYKEASQQLTESLGGAAGSARGGASGALGGAQGEFWADAGTQMGQQAWGMVSPIQQMGWQAELQGRQFPYTAAPSMMGGTYSQPVVQQPSTTGASFMSMLGQVGMGLGMGK